MNEKLALLCLNHKINLSLSAPFLQRLEQFKIKIFYTKVFLINLFCFLSKVRRILYFQISHQVLISRPAERY